MKKTLYILLTSLLFSTVIVAQDGTQSIIEDINTRKAGQGNVRVLQDETIDQRLALYNVNTDTSNVIRLSDEKVLGYKIQVFSGNNQHKSRQEAESKQSLIRQSFPQHKATVSYDSPSWRLRVGNFLTKADAEIVLKDMRDAFPTFGKEMYVIGGVMIQRPLRK